MRADPRGGGQRCRPDDQVSRKLSIPTLQRQGSFRGRENLIRAVNAAQAVDDPAWGIGHPGVQVQRDRERRGSSEHRRRAEAARQELLPNSEHTDLRPVLRV